MDAKDAKGAKVLGSVSIAELSSRATARDLLCVDRKLATRHATKIPR